MYKLVKYFSTSQTFLVLTHVEMTFIFEGPLRLIIDQYFKAFHASVIHSILRVGRINISASCNLFSVQSVDKT